MPKRNANISTARVLPSQPELPLSQRHAGSPTKATDREIERERRSEREELEKREIGRATAAWESRHLLNAPPKIAASKMTRQP